MNIENLPPFLDITHHPRWIYRVKSPVLFHLPRREVRADVIGSDNKKIASLYPCGDLVIHEGYMFDGVTKGPDLPASLGPALMHDLLYQCLDFIQWPYTRKDADELFRDELKKAGVPVPFIWFMAVRLFGGLQRAVSSKHHGGCSITTYQH